MKSPKLNLYPRLLAFAVAIAAVSGLIAVPWNEAAATPVFETLGSPNSMTPFSARIIPTGPDSSYFNPTLLMYQPGGVTAGLFYSHQHLDIDYMDRPAGADLTDAVYNSTPIGGSGLPGDMLKPAPTDSLVNARGSGANSSDNGYFEFGTTLSLYKTYLTVGYVMLIPLTSFQSQHPFFADEREQVFSNSLHFELLGDRLNNASIALALAGRPVKWLTLGLGLTIAMTTTTTTQIFLNDQSPGSTPVTSQDTDIGMTFVPQAAITFEPISNLLLSLVFHWRYQNPTTSIIEQQAQGYTDADGNILSAYKYDFSYGYLPWNLGLGVSWTGEAAGRLQYTVAASATWNRWSEYVDRRNEKPVLPWHDTVPVTLAGKFLVDAAHEVALDMMFQQSPVPDQDGRTNYVDNDRFGIATGYTYHHKIKKYELTVGAQFQCQYLLPRSVLKSADSADPVRDEFPDSTNDDTDEFVAESAGLQTNNPGYPGFSSSGWIMGAGVKVSFHF